jgi:anti-anti-sigma factor
MGESIKSNVRSHCVGTTAVVYASDYLNKLTGERIERECKKQLDSGARALVIDFGDTELVNSIGISILLGIIDIAEKSGAMVVFSDVNSETVQLFEMLGLTRHVVLAKNEHEALSSLSSSPTQTQAIGH